MTSTILTWAQQGLLKIYCLIPGKWQSPWGSRKDKRALFLEGTSSHLPGQWVQSPLQFSPVSFIHFDYLNNFISMISKSPRRCLKQEHNEYTWDAGWWSCLQEFRMLRNTFKHFNQLYGLKSLVRNFFILRWGGKFNTEAIGHCVIQQTKPITTSLTHCNVCGYL